MMTFLPRSLWRLSVTMLAVLLTQSDQQPAYGNPTTATATFSQGTAAFSTSGSQLTITTPANTFINWQSFNIAAGETTTFVQPSSSSVVWNQINDPNPSQILGTLNANGYVVLQNQSGFYIGGSASINAHGLIMSTAPSAMPNLSSGGAWQFNASPPTAKIINYGQINITGGGSVFLIASDIENNNDPVLGTGTISAPGGNIGLYAGQQVLVSMSPDGRALSARVTLPQGSVDNEGKLIADAGSIIAQAKTVNQGGLIQANSVQSVNGVIELLASDSLTLTAGSDIEAHGDNSASSTSPGGMVVLKSDNTFADNAGSIINVAASTSAGGQDGIVEIFGNNVVDASSLQSSIGNNYAVLINPYDLTLSGNATDMSSSNPNLNVNDLAAYSQIALFAKDNIELSTVWSLTDPGAPASLSLQAGNNLILDDGTSIQAGNNWSVNLTAGTGFIPTLGQPTPVSGSDGIYLNGNAYIQTQNGNINLWAANEIQVGWSGIANPGVINTGIGSITTLNAGSINVTALYGDVNTGSDSSGFVYKQPSGKHQILLPPYYSVSSSLGGISTAAGGNVTINAGGNVISYLPSGSQTADAGTGAFGSEPGNVTITAGGNVYGHYVLANGVGTITAGQNVGVPSGGRSFALSLIAGSWNINAPNGNIYVQEVRNPNGIFNNTGNDGSVAAHLFDYAPDASVTLDAGIGVYLTDVNLPRLSADLIPAIYPPILNILAGSGGVTLQDNITLFPSAYQNLNITTTDGGSLVSAPNTPNATPELLMSDSSQTRWVGATTFSDTDHSTGLPVQAGDPNPVVLNISGNMANLNLISSKATQILIGGDMIDCGFSGQNLHSSDVTSITVVGQIYNRSPYDFVNGVNNIPSVPVADLLPGMGISWDNIFTLALNPVALANLTIPANVLPSDLAAYIIKNCSWFQTQRLPNGQYLGSNPGFVYNQATGRLGFAGQMSPTVSSALSGSITLLRLVNGAPVLDPATGHYQTDTYSWVDSSIISTLYNASINPSPLEALAGLSVGAPSPTTGQLGYRLGGPGQFDINAGSISLGNSYGILSCGVADPQGGFNRYADLSSITQSGGATVNVTTTGNLDMLTSTIAAIGGGNVNVTCGGSMDLGSEELFNTARQVGFGIFTSGNNANVNVTAVGNIDINGSRIATFNGGNVFIESLTGDVNAGNGGANFNGVAVSYVDPVTGQPGYYKENVYGNGILANTLVDPSQVPGAALIPGNITVETPRGSIYASLGGILQEALNGNIAAGPTITLTAGTVGPPSYVGNIDLGDSGVIGGTVNVTANGNINGLVISRQNSTISAGQNFSGTVLSGGSANVSGGGTVSGTIIGVNGATVSGGVGVTADVLSQKADVGGVVQSTLAPATASNAAQSGANQSSTNAKQLASNTDDSDDDKKHKLKPSLSRHLKRVTVILPRAS